MISDRAKVLIYHDTTTSTAVVLEIAPCDSQVVVDDLANQGVDMKDWASDLGIYEKGHGLYVWEGNVLITDSSTEFEGRLREPNADEWGRIQANQVVWDE